MGEDEWEIYQTDEVAAWMQDLQAAEKVEAAVDVLAEYGPTLGRPLVDTLAGSKLANLKELRPRQTNIRVLFVFDPWRSAILLVAGDKTGQWSKWYEGAIPQAEQLFALYLKERAKAEEGKSVTSFSKWDRDAYRARVGEDEAARRRGAIMAGQWGYQLAEQRKRLGFTQAGLAQIMGVTPGRVSQIEHGEVSTVEALASYIAALGGKLELIADIGGHLLKMPANPAA